MCRLFCLLILALLSIGLPAQEVVDSTAVEQEEKTVQTNIVVDHPDFQLPLLRKGVAHSLLKVLEKKTAEKKEVQPSERAMQSADSLREAVFSQILTSDADEYLYDVRLPMVSDGVVHDTTALHLKDLVRQEDRRNALPDSRLHQFEHHYDAQLQKEKERSVSRYKYASDDPRRFRFARRKFDVPTQESQIIDTRNNVLTARLIDESDLDLGDATLDGFGQTIVLKADKWHWKGDHTLQMQQTALSDNWYKGGENNMSVSSQQKFVVTRYDELAKTTFDMTIDLKLSGYYTKADTVHAMKVSDNVFSLDMKYSYRAWKRWYYSGQLYAKTPIFDQYPSNSKTVMATFLSPLELNLSAGMDYKYTSPDKKLVYSLMLAPLSYNVKYVRDSRVNPTSYGISDGDYSKHEFGSTLTQKLDWKMGKNVTWSSRLYCFTTYSSTLVEFENTFNFSIGRFFSARIYAYPRFDDSKDNRMQVKEMLTFGFNYQW